VKTKAELQDFYDRVGWQPGASAFTDTELFEDLRAVSEQYLHACHRRVSRHLPTTGRYLLDAGSGPIAHEDYLQYSAGYDLRICVDFSITALREIKRKLGDRALCVLADVTNLPFHDGTVDAAISLHTIYHVPQAEQRKAFTELHRVLVPAGRGVIVDSWGDSRAVRLVHGPLTARAYTRAAAAALKRSLGRAEPTEQTASDANPNLYFAPIGYRWFVAQRWPFEYEILTWRSLSTRALQAYVPDSPRGEKMLRRLERIEDRFPALAGRWGQYPLIAIRKPP
jgi:SAM-dependent methyltransferase